MKYKSELPRPFTLFVDLPDGQGFSRTYAKRHTAFAAYDRAATEPNTTRVWLTFYAHKEHRGSLVADSNLGGRTLHVDYELSDEDLPAECIADCSAQGAVDDAVEHWRRELNFTVDRARAIRCLDGYGAWEDLDEESDETLARRVLWLACGDFKDGSDVFCLE